MEAGSSSSSSCSSISSNSATDADSIRRHRVFPSNLYFDIPQSKVPLIYSKSYDISFFGIEKLHPFDSGKWGRICQLLVSNGVVDKDGIVDPLEASDEDLLVVHTPSYLNTLKSSLTVSSIIEVPPIALLPNYLVQKKILSPFRKQVGGTILAAKLAKEVGWAVNIGGGFHHSSREKGGGFCIYADISLCIHFAFLRLNITKVMIIDLDAHQGNGHEIDFSSDSRVYILDMYNPAIYPLDFEARRYIDKKVEVNTGTTTEEYLNRLDKALEESRCEFDPEMILFNAGTDIIDGDPLGMLKVSGEGICIRDEMVFGYAKKMNVPIIMLTSGGYMKSNSIVIVNSLTNLSTKGFIL